MKDHTLVATHTADGTLFGDTDGRAVSARKARELQADLFTRPAEDGLFPGFSQTWRTMEQRAPRKRKRA